MKNHLHPVRILFASLCFAPLIATADFEQTVLPFLESHCLKCHGGEKTKGHVDFSTFKTMADAERDHELWETVAAVIEDGEMPPDDEPPLSDDELILVPDWYKNHFLTDIEARPGDFKPRRLSGPEYRNTLRSLFGFDLEVNIIEAEQTVVEKSLVLKLLPTDPPGASGYINDTHGAKLSTSIWDQYSYLTDVALEKYLAEHDTKSAHAIARDFIPRALRRPVSGNRYANIKDKESLRTELKAILMSPGFLYRGFLMPAGDGPARQRVDDFELAERLSYFLWEDMPDQALFTLAENGELRNPDVYTNQIDRMLASPKSITLAESFGKQWLLLDQISDARNDPVKNHAYRTQPRDFLYWLISENRTVMELIDSNTTFANNVTAAYYPGDRKQMKKYIKARGIERQREDNQKLTLENTTERGGLLTMPGILMMNKGPVLRGTWMLRQILGEHLGEPPADVPAIKPSPKGQNLSFRERFEEHRANESCAICHDKLDPLGFALDAYDETGKFIDGKEIDTSGTLPGGETFADFDELKAILMTGYRQQITRNAVEQMLAYALCRKLERYDRPTVDALTEKIVSTDGTWRDLIHGIANSLPFTETMITRTTTAP